MEAAPIRDPDFAAVLARIGGFESPPLLAAAVSGGADSLALCLLADRWCRNRGGRLVALTVDHGLRTESLSEAAQVQSWLSARNIPHETLTWTGPKPGHGVQAAARAARYELLAAACRRRGIRHLLLGHQLEDQAETFLLRLGMHSGVDGLAGMPAVRAWQRLRVIRPLLAFPKTRLEATCRAAGQPWIDDPSNQSEHFTRVRLRRVLTTLIDAGISPTAIVASMAKLGAVRSHLESETDQLLAATVRHFPEGWLVLSPTPLREAPRLLAGRVLQRSLQGISGRTYPVRSDACERLLTAVLSAADGEQLAARTLAGCRILTASHGDKDGEAGAGILICREAGAIPATPVPLIEPIWWDRRFHIQPINPGSSDDTLRVAPILGIGRAHLVELTGLAALQTLPAPILSTLPGLWHKDRLIGLPHIPESALDATFAALRGDTRLVEAQAVFSPAIPITSPPVSHVWTGAGGSGQNGIG